MNFGCRMKNLTPLLFCGVCRLQLAFVSLIIIWVLLSWCVYPKFELLPSVRDMPPPSDSSVLLRTCGEFWFSGGTEHILPHNSGSRSYMACLCMTSWVPRRRCVSPDFNAMSDSLVVAVDGRKLEPLLTPSSSSTLQNNFVTDFAIGIGLDNVGQCTDLVKELSQLAVMFFVLEKLGLVAAPTWFERWIDHLSIESTLLLRQRRVLWDRIRAFLQFHRRIET